MATVFKPRKRGPYYARFRDEHGSWVSKTTGCRDKQAARAIAVGFEQRAEQIRAGVRQPHADALECSLQQHVEDFSRYLKSRRVTHEHHRRILVFIRDAAKGCKWARLGDIDAAQLANHADGLRISGRALSARAINARLGAVKQFTNWAVKQRRLLTDPLVSLVPLSTDADRKLERRALEPEELARLLAATLNGSQRSGLTPEDRHALYAAALGTGFRRDELATLKPEAFDFTAIHPKVTLSAIAAKNSRGVEQPIVLAYAEMLRPWMIDRPKNEPLWRMPRRTSDMIRADLLHARSQWIDEAGNENEERNYREESTFLAYVDDAGRQFDFHALRGQYITELARAGVTPQEAQKLARHSDINLTLKHYTHLTISDLASAVAKVVPVPSEPLTAVAMVTGTHDAQARNPER